MKILIAGSSGYYGNILTNFLIKKGNTCIGVDLLKSTILPESNQVICDITNYKKLESKLKKYKFDVIIHLATQIDFAVDHQTDLYNNNIRCTKNLIKLGKKLQTKKIIFTSSNSIYLGTNSTYITDAEIPIPIDMYGKSKIDSETLLLKEKKSFKINILRCPNIIDSGRVGMLSILFELLESNSTLWLIGNGEIKHQCIFAQDLNKAIYKLISYNKTAIFNIGSDNVPTFKELFSYLIIKSNSRSKLRSLPSFLIIPIIKFFYKLKLSPMGPYQFRMLTKDFIFDLKKIKKELGWAPTKNNSQIIHKAYLHYINKNSETGASANSKGVSMGILSVLKLIKI
jgi:UDP-glucose 4-epimerase